MFPSPTAKPMMVSKYWNLLSHLTSWRSCSSNSICLTLLSWKGEKKKIRNLCGSHATLLSTTVVFPPLVSPLCCKASRSLCFCVALSTSVWLLQEYWLLWPPGWYWFCKSQIQLGHELGAGGQNKKHCFNGIPIYFYRNHSVNCYSTLVWINRLPKSRPINMHFIGQFYLFIAIVSAAVI